MTNAAPVPDADVGLALSLTRILDAPPALVYRMWADPVHLRQWSCPRGFTIPAAEGNAVAPGEAFRTTMRAPDGTDHVLRGRYLTVRPGSLLAFTHCWEEEGGTSPETTVTVRFDDLGDGRTRLVLTQTGFATTANRDGHEDGWNQTLDKLAEHVAR